jgi:histidine ammonia-lyase
LAALTLPLSLEYRVGLAFLASTAVATAVLVIALQRRTRRPLNPHQDIPQGELL